MNDRAMALKGSEIGVTPIRRVQWKPRIWLAVVLLVAAYQAFLHRPLKQESQHDLSRSERHSKPCHGNAEFLWRDIEPSENLIFHDCYDGFQCARLEVPLDWNRTDGKGLKVAIAIAKLPARVPISDPRYGGTVLINPGTCGTR